MSSRPRRFWCCIVSLTSLSKRSSSSRPATSVSSSCSVSPRGPQIRIFVTLCSALSLRTSQDHHLDLQRILAKWPSSAFCFRGIFGESSPTRISSCSAWWAAAVSCQCCFLKASQPCLQSSEAPAFAPLSTLCEGECRGTVESAFGSDFFEECSRASKKSQQMTIIANTLN